MHNQCSKLIRTTIAGIPKIQGQRGNECEETKQVCLETSRNNRSLFFGKGFNLYAKDLIPLSAQYTDNTMRFLGFVSQLKPLDLFFQVIAAAFLNIICMCRQLS